MNDADFQRNRSSLQLSGKGFIIIVVIVFSTLSFTLGYFVGKSSLDGKPDNLSQPAEITPAFQNQESETLPQPQSMPVAENTLMTGETDTEPPTVGRPTVGAQTTEPPKENNQKSAVKESPVSQDNRQSNEPLYTVQLNAFKNSSDAKAFSKKQTQQGLKTYITTSVNAKQEKLYKVKTGEFKDRKKAEVMSLKLNKTGKLKTFVTLKNE